jgi:uncharacterized sporulation protein YeaH/YhbH (DUF444 family)
VGKKRNAYKHLVGKLKERNHFEDLGVDGRMTLKRTLNKQDERVWASFVWLRRGTNCRLFSHGNRSFSSIKCSEFLN